MRQLVACLTAVTAATVWLLASAARPAAANQQVRMSWQEFSKDPARVASLVRGIGVMKKRDAAAPSSVEYRGSWQYWAAMHAYYGKESSNGTVADGIAFLKQLGLEQFADRYKGIPDLVPPDDVAKQVWNGCRHSFANEKDQLVAQNFFAWHRLFLYYFERVLRAAAEDDTLRLPYWDYSNPGQTALPSGFGLVKGKPAQPMLFEPRRVQELNEGTAVISPNATDIDTVLGNDTFEGVGGFSWGIESGVHGTVHCIVGITCPVPFMGDVAVSANDPVFWLHHANIDRIFECWMKKHSKKPAGSFATDTFAFVDETGTLRKRAVGDLLDADTLEYRYDNVVSCTRPAKGPSLTMAAPAAQPQQPPATVLAAAKSVTLAKPVVRVALPPLVAAGPGEKPVGLANAEGVELVLSNIAYDKPPGAIFHVYIGRAGNPDGPRAYVGTLNFFGAGKGHAKHGAITRHFDVTAQTRTLADGASAIEVTFEATTGLEPAPGTAAGPPKTVQPAAPTTIGTVELRARVKR